MTQVPYRSLKRGITSRANSRIDFFVNSGSTLGKSIMHCK